MKKYSKYVGAISAIATLLAGVFLTPSFLEVLLLAIYVGLSAIGVWLVVSYLIRHCWPARIPRQLAFEHELASDKTLREVAVLIARKFRDPVPGDVVCLGPVRGTAPRVLFHSGPHKRYGNIYRFDYLVVVKRVSANHVSLVLELNRPYSYLRIRKRELEPLVNALRQTLGGIASL